jgi:hypothetical protein
MRALDQTLPDENLTGAKLKLERVCLYTIRVDLASFL